MSLLFLSLASFLLSLLAVVLIKQRFGQQLLDIPNDRSSHTQPTPRGGGLGFILAFALTSAIATCISHPNAAKETFLISDGEAVSTPELIRRIANTLDQPVRLFPMPPSWLERIGQLTGSSAIERLLGSLTVDSRKIQQTLDWQPPFTMTQGLEATADWYLQRQNSTND